MAARPAGSGCGAPTSRSRTIVAWTRTGSTSVLHTSRARRRERDRAKRTTARMISRKATTPPMIQPTGVELVSDCATTVVDLCASTEVGVTVVGGTEVVVATVGCVTGSVVGLVVVGSVVEGAVVLGTSVVTVGDVVSVEVVVEGTVAEGEVTDGEVSGRRLAFPPPPQAATVAARTMSATANHRRPRRPAPMRPRSRVVQVSTITGRSFASPASNHSLLQTRSTRYR